MKRAVILICVLLLFPVMLHAQGKSLLPTELPKSLYGSWFNNQTHFTLVITKEYLVLQHELYYYETIERYYNELHIRGVNKDNERDIVITGLASNNLFLDIGDHITTLKKSTNANLKQIAQPLIDSWYTKTTKIKLQPDTVQFADKTYQIDFVTTSNDINYTIVVYYAGAYYALHNIITENGHFLNANFLESHLFKKASFYQKNKNILVVMLFLLLVLSSFLIIRWNIAAARKKEYSKRKFTEMQLKSFRSQMNPHFLFNALSAIQNLINQGDNEKANHYLTEFSQLMRLTLDKTENGLVPLSDEIESIKKYLEIEKLRLDFKYEIHTDGTINQDELEIPAMLVQPFVENAIIHGLKEIDTNRTLSVSFTKDSKNLICMVVDNGIGVNASKASKYKDLNRDKYGLKLAEDRIQLINETYNTNAKISIKDRSESQITNQGTEVKIIMPLHY
ncbi:histidine kinase [Tamlana agarivorans]|uniref:Histidine kinase n=1 Tax=Pseudotamlana agarivorans TaxID=481183 RepID=A0ACC5U9A6_9FLAO|nr:histidine kinase [Tamlana agarivorans]MBU2950904.1 histidine kinase [Tamlana agarivorans]